MMTTRLVVKTDLPSYGDDDDVDDGDGDDDLSISTSAFDDR